MTYQPTNRPTDQPKNMASSAHIDVALPITVDKANQRIMGHTVLLVKKKVSCRNIADTQPLKIESAVFYLPRREPPLQFDFDILL